MVATWIVFEGIDGTGKTSLKDFYRTFLLSKGKTVLVLSELGSKEWPDTMKMREMVLHPDKYQTNLSLLYQDIRELLAQSTSLTSVARTFLNTILAFSKEAPLEDDMIPFPPLSTNEMEKNSIPPTPKSMKPAERELLTQAIRSCNFENVIVRALDTYDFILQDRSILSGLCYGSACGNEKEWLIQLVSVVSETVRTKKKVCIHALYDRVVYLHGDVAMCLKRAKQAKTEFIDQKSDGINQGDFIERQGIDYMSQVRDYFNEFNKEYQAEMKDRFISIDVNHKTQVQVQEEMLQKLNLQYE